MENKSGVYVIGIVRYNTIVFQTTEATNQFLEKNQGYGVIGEDHKGIHCTLNSYIGEMDCR